MTVEQSHETPLDLEKRELFAEAVDELVGDIQRKHGGTSGEDARTMVLMKLQERWRVAQGHYRNTLANLTVPNRKHYQHWEMELFEKELSAKQEKNADDVRRLWIHLANYFKSGSFYGSVPKGEPEMTSETAKELVKLLVKEQGGR